MSLTLIEWLTKEKEECDRTAAMYAFTDSQPKNINIPEEEYFPCSFTGARQRVIERSRMFAEAIALLTPAPPEPVEREYGVMYQVLMGQQWLDSEMEGLAENDANWQVAWLLSKPDAYRNVHLVRRIPAKTVPAGPWEQV